ncbi:hypothetical protein ACE1AT_20400 [Pelatocladus sp. BLCC-F211]|uniref:hypothetical protein n=1 Tax=Pelatocladus sp. BLCC-F211 TaxID=3342752 RepID=UPI0035B74812
MPKIKMCDRCLFYSHDPHVVCAVHPTGPANDTCLDFRPDPELEGKQFVDFLGIGESDEEQWEPQGARYINDELVIERVTYNGEEIIQPPQRWSREQQLYLLDNHPLFTGKCPACGAAMNRDYISRVHWDCECGWMDDSV